MPDALEQLEKALLRPPTPEPIQAARSREVAEALLMCSPRLKSPDFETLAESDLGLLFKITDTLFLDGRLNEAYRAVAPRPLRFRLSRRMVTTGGTTTMSGIPRRSARGVGRLAGQADFEIAIATTPLFQSFGPHGPSHVSGCLCPHRLAALQRVMEHEMIHLAEFLCWDDSSCHRNRFRQIARNRFGHRESTHQLRNHRSNALEQRNIRVGDPVRFELQGKWITGRVNRITKRASVLVPDRRGRLHDDGQRYGVYYVPIERLRTIESASDRALGKSDGGNAPT